MVHTHEHFQHPSRCDQKHYLNQCVERIEYQEMTVIDARKLRDEKQLCDATNYNLMTQSQLKHSNKIN